MSPYNDDMISLSKGATWKSSANRARELSIGRLGNQAQKGSNLC